jgi:adenine-specific DNA-methyltransferase
MRSDGAIVVSIDHHESHTLRHLLDEVFGPENHVANVVWQKKYTRANDARFFSDNHEYLFVYARDIEQLAMQGEPRSAAQDAAYTNPDGDPRGPWKATPIHAKSGNDPDFVHTFANGVVWSPPPGTFPRFSHERLDLLEAEEAIWFGTNGQAQPNRKTYLADLADRITPTTLWLHTEVGNTHEANTELKELGLAGVFNNPKPTRLIRRVLQLFTGPDDIVLDFFAGSGSTAHAVALENAADGGKRRCISVQSTDKVPAGSEAAKAGYATLDQITAARIRAVVGDGLEGVRHG